MVALLVGPEWSVAGPSDGLPIVLVHAAGLTRDLWLPQMERLSADFRLMAVDLPGHGTRASERFTLDTALDGIRWAIAEEAHGPVLLVGISLGGFVVNAFVGRWPELTTGLVLASSSVAFDDILGPLTRLSAGIYDALVCHMPAWAVHWLEHRRGARLAHNLRNQLPLRDAEPLIQRGFYFRDWGKSLLEVVHLDLHGILRGYDKPVLVLSGERDTYNRRYEVAQAEAAQFGSLRVLYDGGHLSNLSNPGEFASAIRSFAHTLDWPQTSESVPRAQERRTFGGRRSANPSANPHATAAHHEAPRV